MGNAGLREANQQFSKIVRAVCGGEEVLLTERGKPFARIVPVRRSRQEAIIRQLVKEGLLRPAEQRAIMPDWKPRRIRGGVLTTQILREERDSR